MALSLEDDDQVLEAALSFVDEFQTSRKKESSRENHNVPDSELQTSRPRRRGKPLSNEERARRRAEINERKRLLRKAGVYADPNSVRNAQTREVAYLRQEMEKLQINLEALQQKHQAVPTTSTTTVHVVPGAQQTVDVLAVPSSWKKLADRQRQLREESEEKNARLKLAVKHHQNLADAFSSFLRKRATQLASEYSTFIGPRFTKHHTVQVLDINRESREIGWLLHQLENAFRNMDAIFTSNGLAAMAISPEEVHMRESVNGKYRCLEFFSYKTLPFDVKATTEATWAYFKGVEKHLGYGNLYNKAAKDLEEPFTIVEDLTKELYSGSARADIRIKQVIRRYVEPERDVVVRVYRAVPVEIKHKLLSRLSYHLQGYAVTKRAPISTPERELSTLQLCTIVHFDQEEAAKVCDPTSLRALTKFLTIHTAHNTRAHCELIENALADQVIAQCANTNAETL